MASRERPEHSAGVAAAVAYAEAVLGGAIPAGRLTVLACDRFLRDKAAAEAGDSAWEFRPDLAEAALLFAGQMPNIKGPEAGQPLRLMPWQKLVFANLFGFVERGTGLASVWWRGVGSVSGHLLELGWACEAERGVAPDGVVEAVDVPADRLLGLVAGLK